MWRATHIGYTYQEYGKNFNPRPPWGGRPAAVAAIQKVVSISIHALRGEGDVVCVVRCRGKTADFNPRPPWGGRRQKSGRRSREKEFQSTPSVGRATRMKLLSPALSSHFNPRPPWGGRPRRRAPVRAPTAYFNPRPPWGGRLARGQGRAVPERISIHALRGEGDRGRRSTYP